MLYVFDKNEQLQAVLKNDGTACPYFEAVHTEKLTGENTFTFTVPADHPDSQYVVEGNLVAFLDLDQNWQLFEVKRVTDTHGDGLTRTAYCEHAYYELIDDFIEDIRPYDVSAQFALTQALSVTRWSVGDVADLGLNSTNFYYESVLSALQKVADIWKGELQFRVVVEGGIISARYVDLLARRGADTGKQFVYSKDIKSIEREVDLTNVATALYGRGKGVEVGEGYGRRLDFGDVVWSTANGDPVDKPAGQEWVGDPEALARWGRPGGRHRFGTYDDPEETDPVKLLQKTWEALQERNNPRITYRLDVADLERLSGYEHEKVRLGDTVRIIDRAFSPALLVEARVVEINRDLLQPENTRITLGNFAPTITDENLKVQETVQTVRDRQGVWDTGFSGPVPTSWLEGIINTLQNEVRAGNGTVTLTDDNGILIVDDPENPTKALRLLGGMFAIANEKDPVTGEWNWRTFGSGDGFTADLLNAGKILTSLVRIEGDSNFYWDGNALYCIDPENPNHQLRINKEGIKYTTDGGAFWSSALGHDGLFVGTVAGKLDGAAVINNQDTEIVKVGRFVTEGATLAGSFTRATVAYNDDGTQVAANTPRYKAGKFGKGVWVEESTLNLLTVNQSNIETDIIEWNVVGNTGQTLTRVTTEKWEGSACAKLVSTLPGENIAETSLINVSAGTTYTFSAYIKLPINLTIGTRLRIVEYTSENILIRELTSPYVNSTNNGWERTKLTISTSKNCAKIRVRIHLYDVGTVYFDGVQLEQKAYATSWITGGSIRKAEQLYYTLPRVLPKKWFGSLFWKPDHASSVARTRVFVDAYTVNGTRRYYVEYSGGRLSFAKYDGVSWVSLGSAIVSFNAGDNIFVAFLDDPIAGNIKLWVGINGGALAEYTLASTAQIDDVNEVYIGYKPAVYQPNGVVDALQIIDIDALEASGTTFDSTFVNDQYTAVSAPGLNVAHLLLANLDDSLTAVAGGTDYGVKVSHSDGSYTQLTADGIKRIVAGENKPYFYLWEYQQLEHPDPKNYIWTDSYDGSWSDPDGWYLWSKEECDQKLPPVTVQLPAAFIGKNFRVFPTGRVGYQTQTALETMFFTEANTGWYDLWYDYRACVIEVIPDSYDYENATFQVRAYVHVKFYGNSSSGSKRRQYLISIDFDVLVTY